MPGGTIRAWAVGWGVNEVRIGSLGEYVARSPAEAERGAGALLVAWSNSVGRPHLLLNRSRKLLWANVAAQAALASGEDVRLQGEFVSLNDADQLTNFEGWLARLTGGAGSWCYQRPNGDGCVLFHAQVIAGAQGGSVLGLSFIGTGSDYAPQWADFSAMFGLTPSEHKLVRLLLDGHSAEDAARRLVISIETARTHIRRAYVKMGVGTREAMFRLLAPFRLN
jgi:DNA-binding CsgD family transcriptional regulator